MPEIDMSKLPKRPWEYDRRSRCVFAADGQRVVTIYYKYDDDQAGAVAALILSAANSSIPEIGGREKP